MSNVHNKAAGLLARCALVKPPFDPQFIAEAIGVHVRFVTFNSDAAPHIHGFYDYQACKIVVNSADSVQEKLFTIAHQLGHHMLHQDYSASARYLPRLKQQVDTPENIAADEFAVALLVPKLTLNHYATVFDEAELSSLFLVSPEIIKRLRRPTDQRDATRNPFKALCCYA